MPAHQHINPDQTNGKSRRLQFILFFSVFFTFYGILNSYIFWRGWQALPDSPDFHLPYSILFLVLSLAFLAGRFLERVTLSWVSRAMVWIGSYWLAAMVYLYIALLSIDLLRLINGILPFIPRVVYQNPDLSGVILGSIIVAIVLALLIFGHWNARTIQIRTLDITIPKNGRPLREFNVVVVSDIHLGTIIGKGRLSAIVDKINALNPDIVLLPGDVVDEDLGPVIRQNLGETLRSIRSKYGVIAITGNHEYIGGVEDAYKYLTEHGITVLRDSYTRVGDSLYVVGREDLSRKSFAGETRMPLQQLMADVDRSWPIILMDHQPFRLNEAAENGVDLQLSGHTHHGQLWPFHFITRKMYEVSWGYRKKGETHYYVSCGVGTWGPPVRIGNEPEIVNIKLMFR
jgi:hypothetical protein